jgi:hypothetical protein
MRSALLFAIGLLCSACPFTGSRIYRPDAEHLRQLDAHAERGVFPGDVRRDPAAHADQVLLWTGIIRGKTQISTPKGDAVEIRIEHHYWDFVEDFGMQRAHAFLSPRGEGGFVIRVWAEALRKDPGKFEDGWMALVWGTPAGVADDGTVRIDVQGTNCMPPGWFSTEMWDYGRTYLLNHDQHDLHILRTF